MLLIFSFLHQYLGEDEKDWNKTKLAKVYKVTVRNVGSINAPIEEAGVFTSKGERKLALKGKTIGSGTVLGSLSETPEEVVAPKSSKAYYVYLHRGEDEFEAVKAFVVDKMGRETKSRPK